MKAVILAAGYGTRLGALTAERPKAALDIAGRPVLWHVAHHLVLCGFGELAVNLHYRPELVRDALIDLEEHVSWFEEPSLLGTAGALSQMQDFLAGDDAFVVHYGDVLTDHDLGGLMRRHRARRALLTLLVHERPGSNSIVVLDAESRITNFVERPSEFERQATRSPWVNSGIYVCSGDLLEMLPAPPCDLARDVVPRALSSQAVYAEPLAGFRCAIDSPVRLEEARAAAADGRWRAG
jgi:NDP-sugar pyrophosphorylase family protein